MKSLKELLEEKKATILTSESTKSIKGGSDNIIIEDVLVGL